MIKLLRALVYGRVVFDRSDTSRDFTGEHIVLLVDAIESIADGSGVAFTLLVPFPLSSLIGVWWVQSTFARLSLGIRSQESLRISFYELRTEGMIPVNMLIVSGAVADAVLLCVVLDIPALSTRPILVRFVENKPST